MQSVVHTWTELKLYLAEISHGGLDRTLMSQGGDDCLKFLPTQQKIGETAVGTLLLMIGLSLAYFLCTLPKIYPVDTNPLGKRFLLLLLGLVFGIELGLKFASRKLLFTLNPCHIISFMELILLASKPNKYSFALLRVLIHYIYGAFIAIVLSHTEGRHLHGELVSFWLQHILIAFIIPPYLVYTWGIDSLEPLDNPGWTYVTGSVFEVHHQYILQAVSLITGVNLNYMLCPAERDPFSGPYYRFAALWHQAFCLLVLGKLYTIVIKYMIIPLLPRNTILYETHPIKHIKQQ